MTTDATGIRRFTRVEFERLGSEGFFDPDERLELIEGVIYKSLKPSPRRATAMLFAARELRRAFAKTANVRERMPLALGDDSEPEPDSAVVLGDPLDFALAHPTGALLVVEVADRPFTHERERKGRLYALNGIVDYWLMDLQEDTLEVYRAPRDGVYRSRTLLSAGNRVSPLAQPEASIEVSDLIPGR